MLAADLVAELSAHGFCILREQFDWRILQECSEAFEPLLRRYLSEHCYTPNRGMNRHFLPVPFEPPCFAHEFFFDQRILDVLRLAMDDRIVADQWGCDVPLKGSVHQGLHVDYARPLFTETPELILPSYMLVVSFGLMDITLADGPIEIAPGTHRMARADAMRAVESGDIQVEPITLRLGDVLIRHPWALHRGSPNVTEMPRALLSIRYVRRWYWDDSRPTCRVPSRVWDSLTAEQQSIMRFPLASEGNT